MVDLSEGQYQIGETKFGKGTNIRIVNVDQVGYEVTPGDRPLPQSDEIRMTRDYIQPGTMQFELAVLDNYLLENIMDQPADPESLGIVSGAKVLEGFKREWRADGIRDSWGAVKPLTYRAAGFSRMLYGRPRNIASARLKHRPGWYGVTCTYQLADTLSYEEEFSYELVSPTASGTPGGEIARGEGGGPSWLKISILGPITNPIIVLGDMVVTIDYSITAGQAIEVNSYPWERRAITSTGLNIGTKLIAESPYLEDLRIPEFETWEIALHGSGTTSETKMLVQWQEAYHAI